MVMPDPLGRWMSVLIQGKGNMKTRIVSIYAPHQKGGPLSAISLYHNIDHTTYLVRMQQIHMNYFGPNSPNKSINGRKQENNLF